MLDELFSKDELTTDAFDGTSTLPPAGDARREELKKRADALEEEAETRYADVGKIPESVFEPDREIRAHIAKNYLEIGVDHPYLKVKWVNYVNQQGTMVWQAKADGWKVATVREFPEADELRREDGTIRVGDVLLMCIPMDRYLLLERREEQKRLRQQYGIEAEIHDLAERVNRSEGKQVFANVQTPETTGVSEKALQTMEARAARQQGARRAAAKHLGERMKQGTIPGVPIR